MVWENATFYIYFLGHICQNQRFRHYSVKINMTYFTVIITVWILTSLFSTTSVVTTGISKYKAKYIFHIFKHFVWKILRWFETAECHFRSDRRPGLVGCHVEQPECPDDAIYGTVGTKWYHANFELFYTQEPVKVLCKIVIPRTRYIKKSFFRFTYFRVS